MRLQLDSTSLGSTGASQISSTENAGHGLKNSTASSASASGDSISISTTSNILGRASASRAARLEQLTQAVQSGTYRVSTAAVSRAIVSNAVI